MNNKLKTGMGNKFTLVMILSFLIMISSAYALTENIFGHVTNTKNEPIQGVLVQLVNISNPSHVFASNTTTSTGFYNLTFDVTTFVYNQTFSKIGTPYIPFSSVIVVSEGLGYESNATLGPAMEHTINGKVTDSCTGNALTSATITAQGNETF